MLEYVGEVEKEVGKAVEVVKEVVAATAEDEEEAVLTSGGGGKEVGK